MGISRIIDKYYELVHPFRASPTDMVPGQLAWVPALFVDQIPYVFDFERASKTDHYAIQFNIRQMKSDDFCRKTKLPVAGLPLNDTEQCLAVKAKKRPCVLLAKNTNLTPPKNKNEQPSKLNKHIFQNAGLFLPLYSVKDADETGGFSTDMVDRIKVLMYEQFFFFKNGTLPQSSRNFLVENSIGRFDRMFISALHHPAVSPLDGKLSSEAWPLLLASLARYCKIPMSAEQADTFSAILELAKECLPEISIN